MLFVQWIKEKKPCNPLKNTVKKKNVSQTCIRWMWMWRGGLSPPVLPGFPESQWFCGFGLTRYYTWMRAWMWQAAHSAGGAGGKWVQQKITRTRLRAGADGAVFGGENALVSVGPLYAEPIERCIPLYFHNFPELPSNEHSRFCDKYPQAWTTSNSWKQVSHWLPDWVPAKRKPGWTMKAKQWRESSRSFPVSTWQCPSAQSQVLKRCSERPRLNRRGVEAEREEALESTTPVCCDVCSLLLNIHESLYSTI